MKHEYPLTRTSNGVLHVTDNLTVQEYPDGLIFIGNEHISFIDVISLPGNLLKYVNKKVGAGFSHKIADHLFNIGNFEIDF